MDWENPLTQYMIDHFETMSKYSHSKEEARKMLENILMGSLYSSRGGSYSSRKIDTLKGNMLKIGLTADLSWYRTLFPKIRALFAEGNVAGAVAEATSYQASVKSMSVAEYLYFLRYFNKNAPGASYASAAESWTTKALSLRPTPAERADLYYELAEAQYRNHSPNTRQTTLNALTCAKAAGMDTGRNQKQIARLNTAKK